MSRLARAWRWLEPHLEPTLVALGVAYLLLFIALQLPGLTNPYILEWDSRSITMVAWRYHGTGLFPNDLIVDFLSVMCPPGWRAIFWVGTLFTDPHRLCKLLPFAGLAVVAWHGYAFGRDAAGPEAPRHEARLLGVAVVVLLVHCNFFWDRMIGANSRALGFPLVVAFIRYAAAGAERRLLGTLLLQALCYPSAFLFCAPAQALLCGRDRGRWLRFGAVTALGLAVLAALAASVDPRIGHAITYAELETLGPQRYLCSLYPLLSVAASIESTLRTALYSPYGNSLTLLDDWALRGQGALVWAFIAVVATLAGRRLRAVPPVLPALLAGSLLAFVVARLLAYRLYLPERMLQYSWPPLLLMGLPLVARQAMLRIGARRATLAAVVLVAALQFSLYGDGLRAQLNLWDWSGTDTPTVRYVATLPKEAVIAAHFDTSIAVHTFAHRKVLFSGITNVPHHYPWAVELERRIFAYYLAYYARDLVPVRHLVEAEHVDYLIVDARDFGPDAMARAKYLEPWTSLAGQLLARGPIDQLLFAHPPPAAVIFRDGPTTVVDLHKLF